MDPFDNFQRVVALIFLTFELGTAINDRPLELVVAEYMMEESRGCQEDSTEGHSIAPHVQGMESPQTMYGCARDKHYMN